MTVDNRKKPAVLEIRNKARVLPDPKSKQKHIFKIS